MAQCAACTFVFLANPPKVEELADDLAWEKTSAEERGKKDKERSATSRNVSTFLKRLKRLRRGECRSIRLGIAAFEGGTILDIGCGKGKLLERLVVLGREDGADLTPLGIEVSRSLAQDSDSRFRKLGGKTIQAGGAEGLRALEERSVAGILADSYLEHEHDLMPVLKGMKRVLQPGAAVVVKVPNFACLNRQVRKERWCGFRWPDHVNYFTPRTLAYAASTAGLVSEWPPYRDRNPLSDSLYMILRAPST